MLVCNNPKMRFYLTFIFSFLSVLSFAQTTIYHAFEETTSGFKILEWNVDKNELPNLYLKEDIDELGRVHELKFYTGNKVIMKSLCDASPWFKIEYPNDSTVVVFNLNSLGEIGGDIECGAPSKTTFLFNPDTFELKSSSSVNIISDRMKQIWLSQISETKLKSLIEQSKTETDSPGYIVPYLYSFQKFKGHFLIDSRFDLKKVYLSEEINNRVLETLPKWFAH